MAKFNSEHAAKRQETRCLGGCQFGNRRPVFAIRFWLTELVRIETRRLLRRHAIVILP